MLSCATDLSHGDALLSEVGMGGWVGGWWRGCWWWSPTWADGRGLTVVQSWWVCYSDSAGWMAAAVTASVLAVAVVSHLQWWQRTHSCDDWFVAVAPHFACMSVLLGVEATRPRSQHPTQLSRCYLSAA